MSSVAGLQSRFQHAVLNCERTPGLFVDEDAQTSGGFAIYLVAYRARLAAALRDNFEVLYRALGDDVFDGLAQAYIAAQPSPFRSIRWYGDGLPAFLDAHPELASHPALADLARMDWALRGAFDAPDAAVLTLTDLAALPAEAWPQQRFPTLPSLRIVDLDWAVEPIWRALNADADAQTAAPERSSHALLVWRPQLECQWRAIEAIEVVALRALSQGDTFAECCAAIAACEAPEPALTIVGLLQRWIADGVPAAWGQET
ncbi:MAG: putative DNA-binding domain-containing protein [Propionivibrio sp.]